MSSSMSSDCITKDYVKENLKSERLRLLYEIDGRDSSEHEHYRLFTALYANRDEILKKATQEQILKYNQLCSLID